MADCFYDVLEDDGMTLVADASDHTRGPWDITAQHAGPPAALLVHAIDRHHESDGRQTTRITCEIRRPVPLGRLVVRTQVLRGGRKVEQLGATMTADGTVVMTASIWRIRTAEMPLDLDDLHAGDPPVMTPPPEDLEPSRSFFRRVDHSGYREAVELRFAAGDWSTPGPARAWFRSRVALVSDAALGPVDRVLLAADSGNGISARFDGLFVNVDLSVHLRRLPMGDWVGLDAATVLTNHGIGYAHSTLHDVEGSIGLAAQSLLLDTSG